MTEGEESSMVEAQQAQPQAGEVKPMRGMCVFLSFRIDAELKEKLDALAAKNHWPVSITARHLINKGLEALEEKERQGRSWG